MPIQIIPCILGSVFCCYYLKFEPVLRCGVPESPEKLRWARVCLNYDYLDVRLYHLYVIMEAIV